MLNKEEFSAAANELATELTKTAEEQQNRSESLQRELQDKNNIIENVSGDRIIFIFNLWPSWMFASALLQQSCRHNGSDASFCMQILQCTHCGNTGGYTSYIFIFIDEEKSERGRGSTEGGDRAVREGDTQTTRDGVQQQKRYKL